MATTTRIPDVRSLLEGAGRTHVSILMPIHPAGQDRAQDPIRFRRLADEAERALVARGLRPAEAKRFLEPARALADEALAWSKGGRGLAVYVTEEGLAEFRVPCALPEEAIVSDVPAVAPLLALAPEGERFFVLALSQKRSRLYRANGAGLSEVEVPGLDEGIDDVLASYQFDKAIQHHSAPRQGSGRRSPEIQHGQGSGHDDAKKRIAELLRHVSRSVEGALAGERAPLVLAAVDYLHPIYREVSRYPHLAERGIEANVDRASADELEAGAREVVRPLFRAQARRDLTRFRENPIPERGAIDLEAIASEADRGRVDALFLAGDAVARPGADPRLNRAAIDTLRHRGIVHVVDAAEMPAAGPAAALFRY